MNERVEAEPAGVVRSRFAALRLDSLLDQSDSSVCLFSSREVDPPSQPWPRSVIQLLKGQHSLCNLLYTDTHTLACSLADAAETRCHHLSSREKLLFPSLFFCNATCRAAETTTPTCTHVSNSFLKYFSK